MVFHMEPTEYGRNVARRVATAIDDADLTQADIARVTGIAPATLNRLIHAKNSTKFLDTAQIFAIARAINTLAPEAQVTISGLMGEVA